MGFPLRTVIVIHTTSPASNAQTDALFSLNIRNPAQPGKFISLKFPTLSHNERERGRTDEYRFDVIEMGLGVADIDAFKAKNSFSMTIHSGDAWLPSAFWVIGLPNSGGAELLVGHPFWPGDQWFSTNTSDAAGQAKPTRFLDENLEVPF